MIERIDVLAQGAGACWSCSDLADRNTALRLQTIARACGGYPEFLLTDFPSVAIVPRIRVWQRPYFGAATAAAVPTEARSDLVA